MSALKCLSAICAALALLGCSTMSREDCANADWVALGERDGRYGEAPTKYDQRREQCAKYGLAGSADDYDRGRNRGLRSYCTPEAGFDAGRNGRTYNGVCSPESEAAFLSEYRIGKQLYDLNAEVRRAQEAYDGAVASMNDQREKMDRARARLREEGLSDAERSDAQRDLDRARRELDRLDRDRPRLSDDIRDAEGRLDDFRQFLARRNR